jgi:hypothetical protein
MPTYRRFVTTYDRDMILKRAELFPPTQRTATASAFAGWVFKLSHNPTWEGCRLQVGQERLKLGPFTLEHAVRVGKCLATARQDESLCSGWTLLYSDPLRDTPEHFLASRLTVDGEPLRCRPDAVMRHEPTGEIVIVERKSTTRFECQIPPDSWPNIRAQLWCYSWIDDWANVASVTLIDDIWRRNWRSEWFTPPKTRRCWQRSDLVLRGECEDLFCLYGGQFKNRDTARNQ